MAGILDIRLESSAETLTADVERMAEVLRHRGPDGEGVWVDPAAGIALGHRRLSIIDLSPEGSQPMLSASGRYVLTYNGEAYNFQDLRVELAALGHAFRGRCDTEVVLAAIEQWGVSGALERLNGMFAFGLWDRRERRLHLARDRMGEKPLYYGWSGTTFLFASQLSALRSHPSFTAAIDRGALALYLRHNCVPAPWSIYSGIAKLPAGTTLTLAQGTSPGIVPEPVPYWTLREAAEQGVSSPFDATPDELTCELERLLLDAIGLRIYADVPLGAFLSGGIDSSAVVALMQHQSHQPVRTFTISFAGSSYDEAADAARVAAHLGTQHEELPVTPKEALDLIPQLGGVYDEPFGDSSQVPTLLLSRLTRGHVTVALSGDGGDELFGGYNRYAWWRPIWRRASRVPAPVRRLGAAAVGAVPGRTWQDVMERAQPVLPRRFRTRIPGIKIQKLAEVLPAEDTAALYLTLVSHWKNPDRVVLDTREPRSLPRDRARWPALEDPTEQMMFLDAATYLPDDILTKVDRASMAVGLEARVPFLDHRVVEFAWRVPLEFKVRERQGKWLLRQVLNRHVPSALVDRAKMGFGPPLDAWLRGPLREWAETLLGERRLREEGFFDAQLVRHVLDEHVRGRRDSQYQLWDVLMFQSWLDAQRNG